MAEFPTYEQMAKNVAEKALDEFLYDGKSIREWMKIIVEQEPKIGHWIEHPEIETSTPEYLMFYECSECGDKQCFCKSDIHKKRFCGNCGCRMVDPQEGSGEG